MNESNSPCYPPVDLEPNKRHHWIPLKYSPSGVFSLDIEGYIVNCSGEACQLVGHTADELKGQSFQKLLADNTISPPYWIDRVKRDRDVEEELELVGRSGQTVHVWARALSLCDTNGNPTRFVVYIREVTERKRLDQLKDEFIGLVSHELRSPLTVIMGAISTVLSEADYLPPEEARQLLQDALWETESLSHLLGNLLELSRAQLDRIFLHVEPVNIRTVVQNTIEKVKQRTTQHQFFVDIPTELSRVNADRIRLERILYNLLENAVKYSPKGGPHPSLRQKERCGPDGRSYR